MQFLLKDNFSRGFELKASYSLIFYVSHTYITQLSFVAGIDVFIFCVCQSFSLLTYY